MGNTEYPSKGNVVKMRQRIKEFKKFTTVPTKKFTV